jgi:5-hydroxyisourate hydrolase-like protein (transthyretin family)
LDAQVVENYGHVRVTDKQAGRPLSKVYVKVYALMNDGRIKFFKDGYTDIRGRFDYTSLNTNELDVVQRLSLLVLSESHGAIVREATPPKQ